MNRDTWNMATMDRYFKPVTLTDTTTYHSRHVSGAVASDQSNKRRVPRPRKRPRPSVQSRFVPIRKRHLEKTAFYTVRI